MTFNFDKIGIKAYVKLLERRTNEVRKKYLELLSHNLYELSPKRTGAMSSNYNISVNGPNFNWDPNKTTPDFYIPTFTIKDDVYMTNNCPYIMYVNYGTSRQVGQNFIERAELKSKEELNSFIKTIGQADI